ncbi:wyosine base formation [Planomonospora sphaerica]|uniref:Wyosine base formation n=1 Tax=Planomonospora sphaerica TaxID=161355 RepID=A0A171CSI9_9ACTN|nr:TIGR03084 family metal-binding protein [Planomonospora sphaerica]GAT67148.1 wyosine base formation [Planomonospora sphaerica]
MTQLKEVIADLTAECDELDGLVAGLDGSRWAQETPAPGWTVAHQIGHLSFVFRIAGLAASDPEAFKAVAAGAGSDFDGAVNAALADYLRHPPAELLGRWREERTACIEALAAAPPDRPVPWLVRPLPPAVLACAGLMETFAHGQDIRDALGVARTADDRLRHVCGFAVLTWEFGYQSRGLTPPGTAFRYELTAPSGGLWTFGPEDAQQRITGPALDFCLLVTRRRHRDDLALTAVGADADAWLDIAQAYRGPAGPGRRPGQFAPVPA